MNVEDMKKYAEERRKFEMADFQEQFALSYTEANKALEELVKGGVIQFCDGFTYEAVHAAGEAGTSSVYVPKDEQEVFFIKALWECVKSGNASVSLIQRRLTCGFPAATCAIGWMEENNFIGPYPNRIVKMSVEEFYAKFGNPNGEQARPKDVGRESYIEVRRRALMERFNRMSDDDDKKDDLDLDSGRIIDIVSDDDDFDLDEDDDDDFDLDEDDDGEDGQEDAAVDLKAVLIACLERGLQDKPNNEKLILGLDGEPQLELKFVNDGSSLKISDGGKTFGQVSQTERKIKNVLKNYVPVELEEKEISITFDNPHGTLMALLTLYSAIDAVKKMK